jgi:hypothetical protein
MRSLKRKPSRVSFRNGEKKWDEMMMKKNLKSRNPWARGIVFQSLIANRAAILRYFFFTFPITRNIFIIKKIPPHRKRQTKASIESIIYLCWGEEKENIFGVRDVSDIQKDIHSRRCVASKTNLTKNKKETEK